MNSNNNASAMKDIGRNANGNMSRAMQSTPPIGFSPSSHQAQADSGLSTAQPAYPSSYGQPSYEELTPLPRSYNRENIFPPSTSSVSLGANHITPPVYPASVYGSHSQHPRNIQVPVQAATAMINFRQPPSVPAFRGVFPPSSNYSGAPGTVSFHSNQGIPETYLLPGTHLAPRFSGFPPRPATASIRDCFGIAGNTTARVPFSSTLLAGNSDQKVLGVSGSPLPSTNNGGSDLEPREMNTSRKKRKACGTCTPCRRKENCGSCMNCVNRVKGKQICIHRKCEVLKKKPGTTPYTPSTDGSDRRKEIDEFHPTDIKRSKTNTPPDNQISGLTHPILHSHFPKFGDVNQSSQHLARINDSRTAVSSSGLSTNEPIIYRQSDVSPQQYSQCPPLEQPLAQNTNNPSVPANETDFISKTLSLDNPHENIVKSAHDKTGSNNNTFSNSLNSDFNQSTSNLLLLQSSKPQQESSFDWNVETDDKTFLSLGLNSGLPQHPPSITPVSINSDQAIKKEEPDLTGPKSSLQVLPSETADHSHTSQGGCSSFNARRHSQHDSHHNLQRQESVQISGDNLKGQSYCSPVASHYTTFQDNNSANQISSSMYQVESYSDPVATSYTGPTSQIPYDQGDVEYSVPASLHSKTNLDSFGQMMHSADASYSTPTAMYHSSDLTGSDFFDKNRLSSNSTMMPSFNYQQPGNFPHGQFNSPQYTRSLQQGQFSAEQQIARFNPSVSSSQTTVRQCLDQINGCPSAHEGPQFNQLHNPGWNYQRPPQPGTQNVVGSATFMPGSVPPNNLGQTRMQHASHQHRRISNASGDAFFAAHQRPLANEGNSQSPMMQTSPVTGPGVIPHSPYAGSIGVSLQSPLSAVVSSPVAQVQSVNHTPPAVNVPQVPVSAPLSSMLPTETYQRNMQTYRTGPVSTINYLAQVTHSVGPLNVQPESTQQAPNHFLANPGSSINYTRPNQSSYNIASHQNTFYGHCEPSDLLAAARLNTNKQATPHPVPLSSAPNTFTERMKPIPSGFEPLNAVPKAVESAVGSRSLNVGGESPNDATPTISPGESGYDSTEHAPVDPSLLHNTVTPSFTPALASKSEQPKNLQAALMGNITRCASDAEESHLFSWTDLPSRRVPPIKAASLQVDNDLNTSTVSSYNHLPHTNATTVAKCTVTSSKLTMTSPPLEKRVSFESAYPEYVDYNEIKMDIAEPSSRITHLRRFSCQGIGASDIIDQKNNLKTSLSAAKLSSCNSASFSYNISTSKTFRQVTSTTQSTPVGFSEKKPPLPSTGYPHPATTFDTPPQTPHTYPKEFPAQTFLDTHSTFPLNSFSTSESACRVSCPQPDVDQTDPTLPSDDLRGHVVTYKTSNGTIMRKTVFPQCTCKSDDVDEAPYYTHLGTAADVKGIRRLFEKRTGYCGKALRIEKVCYTGKEGKTARGCPIAKWILRRASHDEKAMVVCRQRPGHHCGTAIIVMVIVLWEGLTGPMADSTYDKCVELIPTHGIATERRCGTNEERTCACQGFNEDTGGASFSFGCSWSMYYNGCKFARSVNPNKFKLNGTKNHAAESTLENVCQNLATLVSGIYKMAAPDAHMNQVEHEREGSECRLGVNDPGVGRPFTGVTCCMDFCAHAHKDQHNMDNGTTIVVTLTKPENRTIGRKPADEQLHVLPLYRWDYINEEGTLHGIGEKIKSGAVEILSGFRREVRLRDKPVGTCKQRKGRRKRSDMEICSPKKKGRKPKKYRSMEDLTTIKSEVNVAGIPPDTRNGDWKSQQWLPSPNSSQFHPVLSPPPRWPFRRHLSSLDSGFSSENNLPSIDNIFSPSSSSSVGLTPPTTPSNYQATPTHNSPFQFGRRSSASLPHSPFNQPFHDQAFGCKTPHDTSLPSLKWMSNNKLTSSIKPEPDVSESTYHSSMSQNTMHQIKQEKIVSNIQNSSNSTQLPPFTPASPMVKREVFSDSEENFHDSDIGGVAIAPGHGSVLIECAKRELHATTSLLKPNRFHPSRISLVFYQHKNMNCRDHGAAEYVIKETKRNEEKAKKQQREMEMAARSTGSISVAGPSQPTYVHPHMGFLPFSYINGHRQAIPYKNGPTSWALTPSVPGPSEHFNRQCFSSSNLYVSQSIPSSHLTVSNLAEASAVTNSGSYSSLYSQSGVSSCSSVTDAVRRPNYSHQPRPTSQVLTSELIQNPRFNMSHTNYPQPLPHPAANINTRSSLPQDGFTGYIPSQISNSELDIRPSFASAVSFPPTLLRESLHNNPQFYNMPPTLNEARVPP